MPGRNGGSLRRGGGNPKRTGGHPPSQVREKLRGDFDKRRKILCEIADDPKASASDRLKAVDLLGKYGLGTTVTETDTDGRDVIRVIREPRPLPVDR
jgi:hypothetical protein